MSVYTIMIITIFYNVFDAIKNDGNLEAACVVHSKYFWIISKMISLFVMGW